MWANHKEKQVHGRSQDWRFNFLNMNVWVAFIDMELERPRLGREEG